ncbi:MAG: TadE/TadG family type IV pilus assembly protein [Anaerolineae bacterium]|nr:pilus assembly protein [Anaerolineae bacterium]MDW8100354.1 TadE/TadG family type IV pilus assembly protein [Anaerolineae bacterium]
MSDRAGSAQTRQHAHVLAPDGGQSATEFALGLLVLALFLLIIFDFGRGIYAYSVISAAAQEGARYGLVRPGDTTGIRNAARSKVAGLEPAGLTINVSLPEPGVVAVSVTYEFQAVTPLIAQILGNNGRLRLQTTATMRQ